jgi:hypothetical protein
MDARTSTGATGATRGTSGGAEERCELSELPVASCGCRKHRPDGGQIHVAPVTARTYQYGLTTEVIAKFPGTCPECGDRYHVGELIAPQRDGGGTGTGRWAHEECAREVS